MQTIKSILKNEKYKGDALLQKQFTVDYLEKKTKINRGSSAILCRKLARSDHSR